ncbi:MAG: hypothetical protein AB9891_08750 [Anaerolineaceae bacterium]
MKDGSSSDQPIFSRVRGSMLGEGLAANMEARGIEVNSSGIQLFGASFFDSGKSLL